MANRPFASVRSMVEAGENVGAYISDPARRAETLRTTAAYTLPNVSAARARESVLGRGSYGEVALEAFPAPAAAGAAAAAAPGPQVAVKKTLGNEDYDSVISEVAALRYFAGVPNIAQYIGASSVAAAGNTGATSLPRILMAPAKSSLGDLLKGPSYKHANATNTTKEASLKTSWGNLYPYAIEDDVFSPSRNTRNSAEKRADPAPRRTAASAASKGSDVSRPLLARSWTQIKNICVQILRGYYAMHSWGVVHRDTKPANMLVTHYGEVQVTDFGVSRYQTPYLEPTLDNYTGTIWYASPEVLMAKWLRSRRGEHFAFSQAEWIQHDTWAVGAMLYQVLTRDPPFSGHSVEAMLENIFRVKGCPAAADGFVFTHYTKLPDHAEIETYPQNPNAIKARILTRAVVISPDFDPFPPDGTSELEQLADIVSGLLTYNPERRMTLQAALEAPLFRAAPTMPPRPIISRPFSFTTIDQTGITRVVNDQMMSILDDWLMSVAQRKSTRESAPFVCDRSLVFYRHFFQYFSTAGRAKLIAVQSPGEQLLSRTYLQSVGSIGFFIAHRLLDNAINSELDLSQIKYLNADSQPITLFKKIFKLYIEGDIPFLGRTYFDELLMADPVLPILSGDELTNRICALGALNAFCYSELYFRFREHLPRLYAAMSEYATAHIADLGQYFTRRKSAFLTDGRVDTIFGNFQRRFIEGPGAPPAAGAAAAAAGGAAAGAAAGAATRSATEAAAAAGAPARSAAGGAAAAGAAAPTAGGKRSRRQRKNGRKQSTRRR